jgi:dipeptidyl-peptidase-3
VASIEAKEETIEENGLKVKFQYGEFAPFLRDLNKHLSEAQKHSANEIQSKMIEDYLEHFRTGCMTKHIDSQKQWIQDKGPIIETNIGFIESYLDPLKIRAEFEGFVAVVNQEESIILNKLVDGANTTLKYLTWGEAFECDIFRKPDFTSLDVLAFASSGIPIGINIPNYDEVREHLGFKNVNLGNAYGKPTLESLQYIAENEKETHLKYSNPSLFVLVALHELLGHGSGKLHNEIPKFPSPLDGK